MRRTCLITGASGKLGVALCESLRDDYDCVAVYRSRVPDYPSNLVKFLGDGPALGEDSKVPLAYCVQADLTAQAERRRVIEVALARFGQIDAVVNCAADSRFHGKLLELSFGDDDAVSQLFVNCVMPVELVSEIFQASWKNDRDGNEERNRCVVNLSSVSGLYLYPNRGQAFYAASKAALNHLTRYLAEELKPYAVRANALCPSRFPDSVPTGRVVSEIRGLLDGSRTGQVVEVLGRTASRKKAR
jgi:NAD(P)-dependent dehydrogenase (short-subunit alcohol dehydrogenase family)